jgi:hypothetical protein
MLKPLRLYPLMTKSSWRLLQMSNLRTSRYAFVLTSMGNACFSPSSDYSTTAFVTLVAASQIIGGGVFLLSSYAGGML